MSIFYAFLLAFCLLVSSQTSVFFAGKKKGETSNEAGCHGARVHRRAAGLIDSLFKHPLLQGQDAETGQPLPWNTFVWNRHGNGI